jgi:DNA-3-methyladenine glycosylase II
MGFPYHAEQLDRMDIEKLRAVGLSYSKSNYIKNVAAKVLENEDYFLGLQSSSDDEVLKELTTIKGVGVWTAQMFLMFTLGRLDVLPLGDVGIQNAVQKFYQLDAKPDPAQLQKIAAKWAPYRTIGCWYLWQALDAKPLK